MKERANKIDRQKAWETARENNLRKYGCVSANSLPEIQEKRRKTCLEKYGVESPPQSEIVKEKVRKTNLERYGVEYHTQTEEYRNFMREYSPVIQEKSKKTCLERYGVEFATQSEEFKRKVNETHNERYGGRGFALKEHREHVDATVFERYGVLHSSHSEEIMKRREETLIERYGVPSIFMTEDFKEQRRKTLLEKYGVEDIMQSEEIRAKIAATTAERYGNPNYFKTDDFKEKSSFEHGFKSAPHLFVESVLDSLGVEYISNDRKLIYPLEIDILIPSMKIGFEINGVYWHSSGSKENDKELSKYHLNKTELMHKAGYRLIHFTDIEIETKADIISSMVSSIVGHTGRRVHARECTIGFVNSATATEFMDSNHLQGAAPCSKWIGLFHEGRLVCLMGFGKARFDKTYDWELIRFANLINTTAVGGFSKCLSFFRKHHSGSIVSYADYSRSNGEVYIKNGFTRCGTSSPSYRWVYRDKLFNRHQTMRRNLGKFLGEENFNPKETEAENCWRNGLRKLWDCGQIKFVLE